jgi:trafficking protein particle complex subunit 9
VSDMRLLTTGVVFESLPQTVTLQPNVVTPVTLHGTPLEVGELEVLGYSTHTLGVKSNCRLKHMQEREMPPSYSIEVVPALPQLDVKTSLPQTATFAGGTTDNVLTSASLTLYNGETAECTITLTNTSQIPIEMIETSLQSSLDATLQNRLFKIGQAELVSQLPLLPGQSLDFKVEIYGEADFLGPIHAGTVAASGVGGVTTMYSQSPNNLMVHEGPHSLSMSVGAPNSLQSRMSSPNNTLRRTDLTSSFR